MYLYRREKWRAFRTGVAIILAAVLGYLAR
jgi:hypothetical protein